MAKPCTAPAEAAGYRMPVRSNQNGGISVCLDTMRRSDTYMGLRWPVSVNGKRESLGARSGSDVRERSEVIRGAQQASSISNPKTHMHQRSGLSLKQLDLGICTSCCWT
jgi:hypothetical protein